MATLLRLPIDRFAEKVALTGSGCLQWTAGTDGSGYGKFQAEPGLVVPAHRWLYEQVVGPIPAGLFLDHLCRNRACVHPAHLEPVTNRENILRGTGPSAVNATKQHCPAGHSYAGSNLYIRPSGARQCRECERERERNRASRVRAPRRRAGRAA